MLPLLITYKQSTKILEMFDVEKNGFVCCNLNAVYSRQLIGLFGFH